MITPGWVVRPTHGALGESIRTTFAPPEICLKPRKIPSLARFLVVWLLVV